MSDETSEAKRQAEQAANGRVSQVVERIADRLGGRATASAVFGDPVVGDPVVGEGITVIPVAKVRWGFGGGGGQGVKAGQEGEGSGGGGGLMASPLGFIEVKNGVATFRRVNDPASLLPVILASAFAAWVVLRSLRKLIR